jgi:hypothetical protein
VGDSKILTDTKGRALEPLRVRTDEVRTGIRARFRAGRELEGEIQLQLVPPFPWDGL